MQHPPIEPIKTPYKLNLLRDEQLDNLRAATLSISLTQELAAAVSSRVDSGLYTSASELIREALRLLLRSESLQRRPRVDAPDEEPLSAHRFTERFSGTTMYVSRPNPDHTALFAS